MPGRYSDTVSQSVSWGRPPAERADAARNRVLLLAAARRMLAEQGPDRLTMDGLAERAGLGKGTVFRRFGTRAGIFQALLDDDEEALQQRILSGPPPLGPGAPPVERLVAYGRARIRFLIEHREIARAALGTTRPTPARPRTPMSQIHIRVLLGQVGLVGLDLNMLSVQLTAALDSPMLLYVSSDDLSEGADELERRIGQAWQDLVERVCRP